jgi:chromosome segregation ATPase
MKNNLSGGTMLLICFILISGIPQKAYPQGATKGEYDKLKKEYEALLADRDNILAQTKTLLESKNKYDELDTRLQKVSSDLLTAQKDLQARIEQNTLLKQKIEDLESSQTQLTQENESLKNSLEKIKIEYKIIPETRQAITRLQKENTDTLKSFQQLQAKIKGLEDAKIDAYAQAESYRRQLNDFKKRYEQALAKNRSLEKKIAQLPSRFAELARENKILVKETALMHYNLGVFYTQGKEYSRAIAEFEKAIELNPDDPYAYYNLGYIYAEYVVDRSKAIDNFSQFLRRAKREDKDVDWVKKYILTWQTWESKKPVE